MRSQCDKNGGSDAAEKGFRPGDQDENRKGGGPKYGGWEGMADIQNADQYQSGQHHAYGGCDEAVDKNEDKNIRGKTVDQAARELINNERR